MESIAVGNHHNVHVGTGTELLGLASSFGWTSNDLAFTVLEGIFRDITQIGDLEVVREEP
jgi:hypothetical protein